MVVLILALWAAAMCWVLKWNHGVPLGGGLAIFSVHMVLQLATAYLLMFLIGAGVTALAGPTLAGA